MECLSIQISDFRNITSASLEFSPGVNVLCGMNAQGKTNLLEAVSLVSLGKSFRTVHDEEMLRFGAECASVSLDFKDSQRKQNITVRMMPGRRKRIEKNHVKVDRVSDIVGAFRTVLFCPEHLSLVKAGPGERRNYLDIAISQLYPVYLKSLQKYNRILKERNSLLRNADQMEHVFSDTVELWSRQLSHEAAVIARYRAKYVAMVSEAMKVCFSEMTDGRETPDAVYEGSAAREGVDWEKTEEVEEAYFRLLSSHLDRERAAGSTLWGIHKDDIDIRINEKSARSFASQGQQRSLALSMKLAEGEISGRLFGETPVFLFDDVFSELDTERRQYLAEKLCGRQVIITSCEPWSLGDRRIHVENGSYRVEE